MATRRTPAVLFLGCDATLSRGCFMILVCDCEGTTYQPGSERERVYASDNMIDKGSLS